MTYSIKKQEEDVKEEIKEIPLQKKDSIRGSNSSHSSHSSKQIHIIGTPDYIGCICKDIL
jgi:hypothetical protein